MMTHANAATTDPVAAAQAIAENARHKANRNEEAHGMAGVTALAAGVILSLAAIAAMAMSPATLPSLVRRARLPNGPNLRTPHVGWRTLRQAQGDVEQTCQTHTKPCTLRTNAGTPGYRCIHQRARAAHRRPEARARAAEESVSCCAPPSRRSRAPKAALFASCGASASASRSDSTTICGSCCT